MFGTINGSAELNIINQTVSSLTPSVIKVIDSEKKEIQVIETPKDIILELSKIPDFGTKGIKDAVFDITLSADGVLPVKYTGVRTDKDGKILKTFDIKNFMGKDTIELILEEKSVPAPYEMRIKYYKKNII